jgi:4Fe-4S ferredoxin
MESSKAECKQEAGVFAPLIDRTRCEAKEDCVEACPYAVFEVRQLGEDDKRALPLVARVKAWVHGNRQAFAVRATECHACGLCVRVCPEHAIKLMRVAKAN